MGIVRRSGFESSRGAPMKFVVLASQKALSMYSTCYNKCQESQDIFYLTASCPCGQLSVERVNVHWTRLSVVGNDLCICAVSILLSPPIVIHVGDIF